MMIGGGYTSTGEGGDDVMVANEVNNVFAQLSATLRADAATLIEKARESGFDINPPIRLRLGVHDGVAYAIEEATDAAFPLFDMRPYGAFRTFLEHRAG
jgi:hypothetical protein